jgi:acetyl-CoA carboxylase/biotin carboxylase 1
MPYTRTADGAGGIAQETHRRFATVQDYIQLLGGPRARVISKILIANNGNAAVKCIRSLRRWSYETFGDSKALTFVVMATPEDLRSNAEYIRAGDVIVDVPGGPNHSNYANVSLIVEIARLHAVHAVWAGWGHASENPTLPNTLESCGIKFIGPAGPPMQALGDKIGSTIIAQSAGVPCIAWNGSDIQASYNVKEGSLPAWALEQAGVQSATQASEAAAKIGFPVMIKASEGGGGKGIRKVLHADDVATAYRQVCGEVPGSPIFLMKLAQKARHLEVQLLADEYGHALALNGRDCSVQRRHQKIIEEGPPVAAAPDVWKQMEASAVALAKAVSYANAGTVEYLYEEDTQKFYFLELNPRLQVEHPVTEMITHVNLPACQLQVAMGLPLSHIPEIRQRYGRKRFDDALDEIDFDNVSAQPTHGHCMAVRITAENAEAGFQPTSGTLQELNFRSTPNVWGYFSMDSSGAIHEFADSQFGHLFASGSDREQARRNMVLALKELSIRGDISTTVDYISKLIELEDFVSNHIDTAWLDGIIQNKVLSDTEACKTDVAIQTLHDHVHVILGATVQAYNCAQDATTEYVELLEKGQLPPRSLLKLSREVELILNNVKYVLRTVQTGPHTFSMGLTTDRENRVVETHVRVLSDGGYLIDVDGTSHVVYLTRKADSAHGMRITTNSGATIAFSPDYDPTSLRTDVAGKLVKQLVPDQAHVKKGEAYAEMEVMKMFLPLKVEEAGTISWHANEGASLTAGDILGTLALDNPENVATVSVFEGDLQVTGWGQSIARNTTSSSNGSTSNNGTRNAHLVLRKAVQALHRATDGYILLPETIDAAMADLMQAVADPFLPVLEIREQLSVLSSRLPATLLRSISTMVREYENRAEGANGGVGDLEFPASSILAALASHVSSISDTSARATFEALITPLREAVLPYNRGKASGVPGAQRAVDSFLIALEKWTANERWFCDGKSYADAVEELRQGHKNDPGYILSVCRAHEQLQTTSKLVTSIMTAIGVGSKINPTGGAGTESVILHAESAISEIGSMGSNDLYREVALKARKLLMQESLPSLELRKGRFVAAASHVATADGANLSSTVTDLLADQTPMVDLLFPLLKSSSSGLESVGLAEIFVRRMYRSFSMKDLVRDGERRSFKFAFMEKQAEGAVSNLSTVASLMDLKRVVSSGSLMETNDEPSESGGVIPVKQGIPADTLRIGVCMVVDNVSDVADADTIQNVSSQFVATSGSDPVNVLYLIVLNSDIGLDEASHQEIAKKCELILQGSHALLEQAGVRGVTFVMNQHYDEFEEYRAPAMFTFRFPAYKEIALYRGIDPVRAPQLDLNRVAANFDIRGLGSHNSATGQAHLYEAVPKKAALASDHKASKAARVFVRSLGFVTDMNQTSFDRILVDTLNAFDLCSVKSRMDNHVFINVASDFEKTVLDPVTVEHVVAGILKKHGERITTMGIVEVEIRIVCRLSSESHPIALRLVSSNPTGYVHVMSTYVEAADDSSDERKFKLIGNTKATLASTSDSSWEGVNVEAPYPLTRPFDAQRKTALRASDTLYCYDLPALFEAAVEQQWLEASEKGGIEGGIRAAARPTMVMQTTELVVSKIEGSSEKWTMNDYFDGMLELSHIRRGAGMNDVGMVAWLVELKTVEYPNGREIVLLSNDNTHKAGSFGTREDVVFKMASEYARQRQIPRLYVAANAGARIGLAEGVKKLFKVAFKDPAKPESGFDFLYLAQADYDSLTKEKKLVNVEPMSLDGETVYRIVDVIGSEPDLGVENLKGSGLIAGETSIAYEDIFTMTVVLGRTVGIGAYLVRLGQRTIQRKTESPIILTGFQALNKLMGVDVYSTHDQLGGPSIMHSNGISHMVEADHFRAIKSAVKWLSYVPSTRRGLLPISDIRGVDDIERPIGYIPVQGVPYDPRFLLTGGADDQGTWQSGFFDKGSFTETMAGWAKAVVVGRARLGGIPMGVIVTENRMVETIKPADPADLTASETVVREAGGVWFPNSAFKTATAIKDFRTEDLPLIVFANWRGFSGGQRDMFDEVLKYGSQIVDAFVAYEQPVFVFIPPFAEIRGGAWVVLDATINANCMEMYATKGSSRGGVLEANGTASVKYRTKDLIATMHRLDEKLKALDIQLEECVDDSARIDVEAVIVKRQNQLLPVYEQISVRFCELHDTPGRMKAVGVIKQDVEWREARSFFYWRLRRKLAEFELRRKIIDAARVGRAVNVLKPTEASLLIQKWFLESSGKSEDCWEDDATMLSWMAEQSSSLELKVMEYSKACVTREIVNVILGGGTTTAIGAAGIVEGLRLSMDQMTTEEKEIFRQNLQRALKL